MSDTLYYNKFFLRKTTRATDAAWFLPSLTRPCTLPPGRLPTQGERPAFGHRQVFEAGAVGRGAAESLNSGPSSTISSSTAHLRRTRTTQHFFSALTTYGCEEGSESRMPLFNDSRQGLRLEPRTSYALSTATRSNDAGTEEAGNAGNRGPVVFSTCLWESPVCRHHCGHRDLAALPWCVPGSS